MRLNNFLRDRRTWQASAEAPAASTASEEAPAAPIDAGPDFSFISEDFRPGGKLDTEAFKAHYEALSAKPEVPETYDFTLPKDLKFDGDLEGIEFSVDMVGNKPLFDELAATLKEMGAPADAAPKFSTLLAKYEASKMAAEVAAVSKEFASLGSDAVVTARIETVKRALETTLPANEAAAIMAVTKSKDAMIAIEKLLGSRGLSSPVTIPVAPPQDPLAARYPNSATR